jgi:hypothetical protein
MCYLMATAKRKQRYSALPLVPPGIPNVFHAAESNDVPALKKALEYYSVNERDEIGMTPLHYAASTLAAETIPYLAEHPDIDATIADKFGRSAVTVAQECWGHVAEKVIAYLNPHCYPWLFPATPDAPSAPDAGPA